jgi:hypothetical protein
MQFIRRAGREMSCFLSFFFRGVILLSKEHTWFILGYLIPLSFQTWFGNWRIWCRENLEFMKLSDERFSVYSLIWILISNTSKSGRTEILRMIPLNKCRRVEKHCSVITAFSRNLIFFTNSTNHHEILNMVLNISTSSNATSLLKYSVCRSSTFSVNNDRP